MLGRFWGTSPQFSLLLTLLLGGLLSAFVNNTPVVVMMVPAQPLHHQHQAKAHEELARQNFEREEGLFGERISSEKEMLAAKA